MKVRTNNNHTFETSNNSIVEGDLMNRFKQSNGIWDLIDSDSDIGRMIIFKLKFSLGLTNNPAIQTIH